MHVWPLVLTATVAVVIGTVAGTKLPGHLQRITFRRMIGVMLVVLGVWMAVAGRG